jgi:hypothetical protein
MLGVERMCHLAVVSRAGYYRHWEEVVPDEAEMAARVSIQEVVLRHRRRYGYRRVTADLHRQGMVINHKRVARIMREDNLLAIRYRKYILTTDSKHDCQVYLNLAARMTVTAVNQFWVADITYILGGHLKTGHRGSLKIRPTESWCPELLSGCLVPPPQAGREDRSHSGLKALNPRGLGTESPSFKGASFQLSRRVEIAPFAGGFRWPVFR